MILRTLAALATLTLLLPFVARAQHHHSIGQPAAKKAAKPSLQPAEGASIKIISPAKGQVLKGDEVPLEYKLTKGKRGHHAHVYVDGELMGMFESERGTLNGIKPGKRTLEMRIVASDHATEFGRHRQGRVHGQMRCPHSFSRGTPIAIVSSNVTIGQSDVEMARH